jgi:hypothetical protein
MKTKEFNVLLIKDNKRRKFVIITDTHENAMDTAIKMSNSSFVWDDKNYETKS